MHRRVRRGEIAHHAANHGAQRLLVVLLEVAESAETHHADVLQNVFAGGGVGGRQALQLRVQRGEQIVRNEAIAGEKHVEGAEEAGIEERSVALAELKNKR